MSQTQSSRRQKPQERWAAVDRYVAQHTLPHDSLLEAVLAANSAAGLPSIDVSPNEGCLLHLLARTQGARAILEIGALGGYSTIWLARALPSDGRLITLEADPKHAEVARANLARAGLSERVELRVGPALEMLPQLAAEHPDPFDLIFIDADKEHNAEYFEWALRLSRPGSLILVDNVIREGAVADPATTDPRVKGSQRLFELLRREAAEQKPRVIATALQTVGRKGYDGFALAFVTGGI